jgi:geranylgeranyl diphosphate synthase, type I
MSGSPTCLTRGRDLVTPALQAAVERLDGTSRAQSAYHFCWTDADGRPVSGEGGKAVRPALALLSAEAAGAPATVGLPGAVAVELVHNFSLLHDDLMDGDVERRHRRTVWSIWGSSSAILTGDAMLALASEVLLDTGTRESARAARVLAVATRELIRGQVLDLAFEQRAQVTLDECLDMAGAKTGALLAASASIGAVLAGAPADVVSALDTFGAQLGLAFQLVDDVLGIWGDPAVTGKSVYSDLRAGKKSLPVTYALTQGGAAGQELAGWLAAQAAGHDHDEPGLRRGADLVAAGGGRDWATSEAARRLELGAKALDAVDLPPAAREELVGLGEFIVHREA